MTNARRIACLVAAATSSTFAAPPEWPCLSDRTFDEVIESNPGFSWMILVVDREFPQSEPMGWDRWSYNDPEMHDWLSRKRVPVVYADLSENPTLRFMLKLDSYPAVIVFKSDGTEMGRRYGAKYSETPEFTKDWLQSLFSTPLHIKLAQQLDEDPNNIELRFRVMEESHRAGDETAGYGHIAWMLDHNGIYAEAAFREMRAKDPNESEQSIEREFRRGLLWLASSLREKVEHMAVDSYDRPDGTGRVPAITGWDAAERLVDSQPVHEDPSRLVQRTRITHIVDLRRSLEARRDAGTATERDLFVLTALTGNSDEVRVLYDSVQQPLTSPEASD